MSETPVEPTPPTPSMLLASGRALDDPKLRTRIVASTINKSRGIVASGKGTTPASNKAWNYAVTVLQNPSSIDPSMVALTVTDPNVAAGISVGDDGYQVTSEYVTDESINAAVNAAWALVSAKYPNDPLA